MRFVMENPFLGAMKARPYMAEMNRFMTKVDYCQYHVVDVEGARTPYPYQKPTCIWTNLEGWDARRCRCEGRRHASSLVGDRARGRRLDFRQGRTPSRTFKHAVPDTLHETLLEAALRAATHATWVLDLFSGSQSLRGSCARLVLGYVSCDIASAVKMLRAGAYRTVHTDIVGDLSGVDLQRLIRRAAEHVGEQPRDLLLVWASPPCDTFSCANSLCRPSLRPRDFSDPARPPLTAAARRDDALVEGLVAQLLRRDAI